MESTFNKVTGILTPTPPTFFAASSELVSHLPLQMLLYFNSYFSLVFVLLEVPLFLWKRIFLGLSSQEQIFTTICLFLWVIAEPFRLFFGYTGNLREKVPQLVAFFILSIFPQILTVIYFLAGQTNLPLDYAIAVLMLFFLVPEIIVGFYVVRLLIRNQATRFYLQTYKDSVNQ